MVRFVGLVVHEVRSKLNALLMNELLLDATMISADCLAFLVQRVLRYNALAERLLRGHRQSYRRRCRRCRRVMTLPHSQHRYHWQSRWSDISAIQEAPVHRCAILSLPRVRSFCIYHKGSLLGLRKQRVVRS